MEVEGEGSSRMLVSGLFDEKSSICIQDVFSFSVAEEVMYCRLCATLSSEAISIYGEEGVKMNLAEKINVSLPIWVSKNMGPPLHVCRICIENLEATINFINQVVAAQKKINSVFQVLQDHSKQKAPIIKSKDASRPAFLTYFRANKFKKLDSINKLPSHEAEKENDGGKHKSRSHTPKRDISSTNTIVPDRTPSTEKAAIAEKILEEIFSVETVQTKVTKKPETKSRVEDLNANVSQSSKSVSDHTPLVDLDDGDSDSNSLGGNDMAEDIDEPVENEETPVASTSGIDLVSVSEKSCCDGDPKFDFRSPSGDLINVCKYCDKIFKWKTELFFHQTHVHKDVVFSCPVCFKVFYDDKEEFSKHVKAHPIPPKSKSKEIQNEHTESNLEVNVGPSKESISVTIPENKTQSRGNENGCAAKDPKFDFNSSDENFKNVCKYCLKRFKWNTELFFHETSVHQDVVFCCRVCFKVFYDDKEEFSKHVKAHQILPISKSKEIQNEHTESNLEVNVGPSKESISVTIFENKTQSHGDGNGCAAEDPKFDFNSSDENFKNVCKYCLKRFKWNTELLFHETSVHQDVVFCCRVCFKVFYDDKEEFSKHVMSHSVDQKSMETSSELTESNSDVSGGPNIESNSAAVQENATPSHVRLNYICKYCSQKYSKLYDLFSHQTESHPDVAFRCSHCSKVFYENVEEFRKHERGHEESRTKFIYIGGKAYNVDEDGSRAFHTEEQREWIKKILSGSATIKPVMPKQSGSKSTVAPSSIHTSAGNLSSGLSYSVEKTSAENVESSSSSFVNTNSIISCDKSSEEVTPSSSAIEIKVVFQNLCPKAANTEQRPKISPLTTLPYCRRMTKTYSCQSCLIQFATEEERELHRAYHHKLKLPCRFCPRTCAHKKQLLDHEASHFKKHKIRCRKCGQTFEDPLALKQHKRSQCIIQELPRFSCQVCKRLYVRENELKIHLETHLDERPFLCEKCGQCFKDVPSLKEHRSTPCKSKGSSRGYSCDVCKKNFRNARLLASHRLHFHIVMYPCPLCGLVFKSKLPMTGHMKSHSEILCIVCKKSFENLDDLRSHRKIEHPNESMAEFAAFENADATSVPRLKCQSCDRCFASGLTLKVHEASHSDELQWKCRLCDESFGSEVELDSHMSSHPGEHPYKCGICDQTFSVHDNLVQHEKMHFQEEWHACEKCGKSFSTTVELVKHYAEHTSYNAFKCPFCPMSFSRKISLLIHQRTHTTRVYSCSVCNEKFSQLKLVKEHEKTHGKTGEDSPVHSYDTDEDALAASLLDMSGTVVEVGNTDHVWRGSVVTPANVCGDGQRAGGINSNIILDSDYSEVVYVSHALDDIL